MKKQDEGLYNRLGLLTRMQTLDFFFAEAKKEIKLAREAFAQGNRTVFADHKRKFEVLTARYLKELEKYELIVNEILGSSGEI